ncbi:hypothetical protein G9464_09290 [Halostella sp. JP-L12]|uniref:hypothetical protein n=1 Tax=Halostella TaxID=1843185 RepID=UPI000EF81784|nr:MULTISPECIES: hypothetical protein [Halostella]NHN47788.1 hypothetical protein [Halostella sp. JP-L12]
MSHDQDLPFPTCCSCCPHLQAVTASCTHDLRQSLVHELDTDGSCPVFVRLKTTKMQRLAE